MSALKLADVIADVTGQLDVRHEQVICISERYSKAKELHQQSSPDIVRASYAVIKCSRRPTIDVGMRDPRRGSIGA